MIDGIVLSFQLFSRIYLPKEVDFNEKNLKTALLFLPLLGLIIGGITGGVIYLLRGKSDLVRGVIGLLVYLYLTGGLHLDGLSDMADGFLANKDKEYTMAAMSDSFLGTFGTIVLILYSILKFSFYGSIDSQMIIAIPLTSFLARLSSLYIIKRGKYAKEEGFGKYMKDALSGNEIYYLIILAGLIILILLPMKYLVDLILVLVSSEIIKYISTNKIGGLTGDIYGATIEINEIISLMYLI